MAAMRAVSLTETPRGPISFDRFGNAVGARWMRSLGHRDFSTKPTYNLGNPRIVGATVLDATPALTATAVMHAAPIGST